MSNLRYDRGEIKGKATRTDEGYVRGDAIVTRTGVFRYLNADGSVRRELRHPDDVFSKTSLDSLRMIPITNGHPEVGAVDSSNADRLSIGNTGENITVDGRFVLAPLTVTHKDGIQSIESGRVELSLGYRCDLEPSSGEYGGEAYDYRQRNIKYNHLALVDQARAGSSARLNLDGEQILESADGGDLDKKPKNREDAKMGDKKTVVVRLDGIDYEASPEVERELSKRLARIDSLTADLKAKASDSDKLQAKLDEADAKIKSLEAERTDEAIDKKVAERVELFSKAKRVTSDKLDGLSRREVMAKVILAKYPETKLDGKSDDYVEARFDGIIDSLPAERNDNAIKDQIAQTAEKHDGKKSDEEVEEKKKDALKAMKDAYKNKDGGK